MNAYGRCLVIALASIVDCRAERPEPPAVPKYVDHLVYAVPDLEAGIREIERLLGVRPVIGGRHPDFGTRNALVSLGATTYLEIIAPDPGLAKPTQGRPSGLDTLEHPRLATWVLREEAIETAAAKAKSAGIDLGAVRSGSREKPDGTVLSWKFTDPYAPRMDGAVPFMIAWGTTPHPASNAPKGGELVRLKIQHPDPAAVRSALSAIGVEIAVEEGTRMLLIATVRVGEREVEIR